MPVDPPQLMPLTWGQLIELANGRLAHKVAPQRRADGKPTSIEPHIVRSLGQVGVDVPHVYVGCTGELSTRLVKMTEFHRHAYGWRHSKGWGRNGPAICSYLQEFLLKNPKLPGVVNLSQLYVARSAQYRLNEGAQWSEGGEPKLIRTEKALLGNFRFDGPLCRLDPAHFDWQGDSENVCKLRKNVDWSIPDQGTEAKPAHDLLGPLTAFPEFGMPIHPVYSIARSGRTGEVGLSRWTGGQGQDHRDIVHQQYSMGASRIREVGASGEVPVVYMDSLHFVFDPETGVLAFVEVVSTVVGTPHDIVSDYGIFANWVGLL